MNDFDQQSMVDWVLDTLDTKHIEYMVQTILETSQSHRRQHVSSFCEHKIHTVLQNLVRTIAEKLLGIADEQHEKISIDMALIPEGCRFMLRDGQRTMYVIEHPPMKRTIKYLEHRYHLAFPYVVYVLLHNGKVIDQIQVAFRPKPIRTEEDKLFLPCLPNFSGLVPCMGEEWCAVVQSPEMHALDVSGQISKVIQYFWASNFSQDGRTNFEAYGRKHPTILGSFRSWQEASTDNPLFFLQLEMIDHDQIKHHVQNMNRQGKKSRYFNEMRSALMAQVNEEVGDVVAEVDAYLQQYTTEFKIEGTTTHYIICDAVADVVHDAADQIMRHASKYLRAMINNMDPSWKRDFHDEGW